MKLVSGIISVLLGLGSLYMMFVKAKSDVEIGLGFGMLLAACLFMCFMIMDEQKEEIEHLRNTILRGKGIL